MKIRHVKIIGSSEAKKRRLEILYSQHEREQCRCSVHDDECESEINSSCCRARSKRGPVVGREKWLQSSLRRYCELLSPPETATMRQAPGANSYWKW